MSDGTYRPKLRRGLTVIPHEETIFVRTLQRLLCLRGESVSVLVPKLLPLLDGHHSVEEIGALLRESEQARAVITHLQQAGLLEDERKTPASAGVSESFLALLDSLGVDISDAIDRIHSIRVGALASPSLAPTLLRYFEAYGVRNVDLLSDQPDQSGDDLPEWETAAGNCSYIVAVLDRWIPELLRRVNRLCVRAKRPWLPVYPESEVRLLVGPFVVPGESACFDCFDERRRLNLGGVRRIQSAVDRIAVVQPDITRYLARSVAPLYESAIASGVTEVLKHALGLHTLMFAINQVMAVCPFLAETDPMPALKLPRCPTCSRMAAHPTRRVWMEGSA